MTKPVVIITGCSSGLGKALAKHLQSLKKYRLVVTTRASSYEALSKDFETSDDLMTIPLDVTREEDVRQVVHQVITKWSRIDILINNAGICFRSIVEHMDPEAEMNQLRTNYLGPMSLIRAVLPIMREQRQGRIINISSASGFISMPTMGSYSASKHALEGASEALWYESKPYGIKVSLIEPGFINSDSFQHTLISKKAALSQKLNGPFNEYYNTMGPMIKDFMHFTTSTPHKIACKIEKLLNDRNPPLHIPVTFDASLLFYLKKLLPDQLFHFLFYYFLVESKKWSKMALKK